MGGLDLAPLVALLIVAALQYTLAYYGVISSLEPACPHTALLRDVFGFSSFRPGQEDIVKAVTEGKNVLAIMPTGGGKSLCFQLPALLREGVTVVISPLIALMRDQVRHCRRLVSMQELSHQALHQDRN